MAEQRWNKAMADMWKLHKPPIRPTKAELAVISKYIDGIVKKNGKNVKVLVLGSTPEYRDLINSKGLTAYICDYKRQNFTALRQLKKRKGKEVFFLSDWKKMKIGKKFDLILGDAALNVIDKKDVSVVLKKVKEHLQDDGLFIHKTWTRVAKKAIPMKKILSVYHRKLEGLDFKHSVNQWMLSHYYDTKKDSIALRDLWHGYIDLYDKGMITKKMYESCERLGYENSILRLYMPSEKVFEKTVGKSLRIVKKYYPKPIGLSRLPLYVMGR